MSVRARRCVGGHVESHVWSHVNSWVLGACAHNGMFVFICVCSFVYVYLRVCVYSCVFSVCVYLCVFIWVRQRGGPQNVLHTTALSHDSGLSR